MNAMPLDRLVAGFEEPVRQAQQVFRQVLAALAEPGTLQQLPAMEAPSSIDSAAYQICLALLDQETPLWLQPELQQPGLLSSLRFHCGCPLTERPEAAAFALVTSGLTLALDQFAQGSHEYPERSTTLIVQVEALDQGGSLCLSGPGIPGRRQVSVIGFDPRWLERLEANRAGFPQGVDLILTAGETLMALPRTTRIQRTDQGEG